MPGCGSCSSCDNPIFENWDQDAAAVRDGYDAQDPERVGLELAEAAERLAAAIDGVPDGSWERDRDGGPTAPLFTVTTLCRYVAHDVVHHVHDVTAPATP